MYDSVRYDKSPNSSTYIIIYGQGFVFNACRNFKRDFHILIYAVHLSSPVYTIYVCPTYILIHGDCKTDFDEGHQSSNNASERMYILQRSRCTSQLCEKSPKMCGRKSAYLFVSVFQPCLVLALLPITSSQFTLLRIIAWSLQW